MPDTYHYIFKLVNKTKKNYSFSRKSQPYKKFEKVKELSLKRIKRKRVMEYFELMKNDKSFALVIFANAKFGLGIIPQSNDILLLKKSIDKLGLLQILVLPDMAPYLSILFQMLVDGHFNNQILSLKSSKVQ